MQFSEIPGLPETKAHLLNAVKNNHLAHALLFYGPEGSANLTMPLALATYLYCQNPTETDSCGTCPACQRMAKLVMPDLNFAFPVIAKAKETDKDNDQKVDMLANWRKFVLEQPYGNVHDYIYFNGFEKKQLNISVGAARQIIQTLSLVSFEGGYKIMMIWGVEFLNPQAANALLKILEEPQQKTIFMLITTQPEQLLTTILSRTQKVMVRGFTDEEIHEYLVSSGLCDDQTAMQISMIADGNLREAMRLVNQVEDQQVAWIRNWFRLCHSKQFKDIFALSDSYHKFDKEAQKSILQTGMNVLREILLKNASVDSLLRTKGDDREFINKISGNVLKEDHIPGLYELFNKAHYHLERNGNAKLIFTDLSMEVVLLMAKID
ncbi:ATP-binding protein [Algoriphagus zhangzhouensis]|uniref:DNA polymerase-3 subunit delta n=1 Tax=Algoriphagus zhangzhouensis TaxID=1073327 RepID=A0A1M7ZEY0_9BACT|nr:DNA polymerase III subunit [Algoriphagus zhangzhouensis]TDY46174.1 DNA polymerase-3 subunit delta' [Algoriphagus zhangzhouensis]SHO63481.1 DNA polymerase-3 subunit delta' [Algoriphagus zhangzhouensis]